MLVAQSCLDSLQSHGLWPARLLSLWNSTGKNTRVFLVFWWQPTRVGCHFCFQGIFPTQGWNLGLLHCRQILYHVSYQGSPKLLGKMIHRAETSVSDSTSRGCQHSSLELFTMHSVVLYYLISVIYMLTIQRWEDTDCLIYLPIYVTKYVHLCGKEISILIIHYAWWNSELINMNVIQLLLSNTQVKECLFHFS